MKAKIRVTLMTDEGERFYGPGVQDLLTGIKEQGSVKEACRAMDLSYSKGRSILWHAEGVLGYQLVKRQRGGAMGGGSATLTPQAEEFVRRYGMLADSVNEYVKEHVKEAFQETGDMNEKETS